MRLLIKRWLKGSVLAAAIGISAGVLPVQAQSDQQVRSLVEALRLAAPQTGNANDGLYSDWQIQAQNIPRWSESCIGRRLSPQQFEADTATARTILVCVVRDVLQQEYRDSDNNEAIAVRRAAAWWMTGDPSRYNIGETATYTQQVLSFYQQQNSAAAAAPISPGNQPAAENPGTAQSTPYDRYMEAGYAAVDRKDYAAAILHFQRALDERPNDTYAQQAIQNVQQYQSGEAGAQ